MFGEIDDRGRVVDFATLRCRSPGLRVPAAPYHAVPSTAVRERGDLEDSASRSERWEDG